MRLHRGRFVLVVGLIVLASLILSACQAATLPGNVPRTPDEISRVTREALWQKMERNANILVVDTRNKSDYDKDHIRGAVSVPASTIASGDWVPPSGKEVILY